MTRHEFRDALCRFRFLDRSDVPFLTDGEWPRFRDDPVRFFLRAEDETADRIWAAVAKAEGA